MQYRVEVSNADRESYENYSHDVTLSFRVRDKDLEAVVRNLLPQLGDQIRRYEASQ